MSRGTVESEKMEDTKHRKREEHREGAKCEKMEKRGTTNEEGKREIYIDHGKE